MSGTAYALGIGMRRAAVRAACGSYLIGLVKSVGAVFVARGGFCNAAHSDRLVSSVGEQFHRFFPGELVEKLIPKRVVIVDVAEFDEFKAVFRTVGGIFDVIGLDYIARVHLVVHVVNHLLRH